MSERRRWEWVEIIEPRTKEHMYANLATGECVWDPPPGVKIKKTDDNQWWELFDQNTSRFYYYNATSQKTVWHRPQNCDIIPLAKLQTLKQNTEVRDDEEDHRSPHVRKEISTQTPERQTKHEHIRTGSIRSTSGTQTTSPHQASRKHRHHHHHHHHHNHGHGHQHPPDATSNNSSTSERSGEGVTTNGERRSRRRGSQSSSSSSAYARRESLEKPQRSLESPRPQRSLDVGRSLDLAHVHRGSLDTMSASHHPAFYARQDSYPATTAGGGGSKDDSFGYARETSSSQYPDVSQITAVQVTPRPKPRAFPRTNPAYVGVFRRDGQPSYKRINIEQHQPPTAIYNQRFYDTRAGATSGMDPATAASLTAATQAYFADLAERQLRSDSDTSHSSYGISRLQQDMTDSQISSHSLLAKHQREHSDSHSSQGSLRGVPDNHSSQGSLRAEPRDSPASSPRHVTTSEQQTSPGHLPPRQRTTSTGSQRSLTRRNSEPDYANLPIVAHLRSGGRIMTLDDPITRQEQELMSTSVHSEEPGTDELKSGDSLRSGDSLSPVEYSHRHGTPSSMRSHSTHNSSHTSEGFPDQGYEDSDNSSVFSDTPSPKQAHAPQPSIIQMETQHASLRRKKAPKEKPEQMITRQTTLEKSVSLQAELASQRPLSMVLASQSEANVIINPATGSLLRQHAPHLRDRPDVILLRCSSPNELAAQLQFSIPRKPYSESDVEIYAQENLNLPKKGLFGGNKKSDIQQFLAYSKMDIEQFALENLNEHKKGLLGKAVPIGNMLTWTKDVIQKPMIKTNDKVVKKEAPEVFKLIQMYMGDRKPKSAMPQLALDITTKGWSCPGLRDEIFIQLCRQTTENKKDDSLMRGWELLGICLTIFPPSRNFHSYLEGYIYRHLDPGVDTEKVPVSHFAAHCQRRLERISQTGAKKGLRKPTMDEIEQAKKSIFHPSMFGNTLDDIVLMQKDRYPDRQLPWIQTILSEEVLRLNGAQTEGIFRVPGDIDEVNALKVRCDQWIPPDDCPDPHIPASLLKLWYRELYEPLIPPEFYDECVNNYANEEAAINIVNNLPEINRLVLSYLIRFLQVFSVSDNAITTKMDVNNLAMVMAPNCLRCESDDPRIIFENTRKEMGFMRTLIQALDTSFMDGVL